MRTGDRIGRWELVEELPSRGGVRRWRGRASDGAEAELLCATASRDDARLGRAHRRLLQCEPEPGLLPTVEVLQHRGRHVAVRDPSTDRTLADIALPLPPGQAAAVAARLLPAVVSAGGATGGALTPSSVRLDTRGHPVLAPPGVTEPQLTPDARRWVAPEAFGKAPPDGAAGLYGLGVWLYEALTGQPPQGSAPPPPSALRRGVPSSLDHAVALLLSADPLARAGALPLLQEASTAMSDLREEPERPVLVPTEIEYTTVAPTASRGRADVATWKVARVVDAADLRGLTPSARSALAGYAGLSLDALSQLGDASLPVVVSTGRSPDELQGSLADVPLHTVGGFSGALPALVAVVALVVALVLASLGAVSLVVPGLGIATLIVPLVLAALVLAVGGVAAQRALAAASTTRRARRGQELAADLRAAWGEQSGAWERLASLRRTLAELDLPQAAETDLRASLKDVESHLLQVVEVERGAAAALKGVDLVQLRTRLATLSQTPDREAERDQLARTLADLQELESQRERMRADTARVEATLDEMAATLAHRQAGAEGLDDATVERLRTHTRLARETLDVLDDDLPQDPRGRDLAR